MLSDFFEEFVMLDWRSQPDGFGGINWTHTDGAMFRAGIATNNSTLERIAEKQGLKTDYTIVIPLTVKLELGDRVRRLRDGRVYKITSNAADMTTPDVAQVQYAQVSAEVVEV